MVIVCGLWLYFVVEQKLFQIRKIIISLSCMEFKIAVVNFSVAWVPV